MRPVATDVARLCVCVSVCLVGCLCMGTCVSCAKTAEPNEMTLGTDSCEPKGTQGTMH